MSLSLGIQRPHGSADGYSGSLVGVMQAGWLIGSAWHLHCVTLFGELGPNTCLGQKPGGWPAISGRRVVASGPSHGANPLSRPNEFSGKNLQKLGKTSSWRYR